MGGAVGSAVGIALGSSVGSSVGSAVGPAVGIGLGASQSLCRVAPPGTEDHVWMPKVLSNGHGWQEFAPVASWYSPSGQASQSS